MIEVDLKERINIVHHTREIATSALTNILGRDLESCSEREICDRWIRTMSETASVCAEGWYQPPPGGAAVLFGDPDNSFGRMNYNSLRNPDFWSSRDIQLHDDSLIYAYASPFDRETALIGDVGVTLYRGSNRSIHDHIAMCLEMTIRIACFAEVGMEFRELFAYAQQQMDAAHLRNETSSTASGLSNIGHTVPWSYDEYSDQARACLRAQNMRSIGDMISKQRVSINGSADLRIQPTMAFTVEPQIASSHAPLCSYHAIITFSEGTRSISLPFRALFKMFAMDDYMQPLLAHLS